MPKKINYNSPKYKSVSRVLQQLRWERNLSTAEVCRRTKMSSNTLFYIEDDLENKSPTLNTLFRLLDCYNINASNFFKIVEGKSND